LCPYRLAWVDELTLCYKWDNVYALGGHEMILIEDPITADQALAPVVLKVTSKAKDLGERIAAFLRLALQVSKMLINRAKSGLLAASPIRAPWPTPPRHVWKIG
jgi:hypothetical protein